MVTPEPRPGDIAMVEGRVAVWKRFAHLREYRWEWIGGGWTTLPVEVGPVLGNVGDIAAGGGIDEITDAAYQRGIDAESFYGGTP